MRDNGNLSGAPPGKIEAMDAQNRAPADDANSQRQSHQQDRKREGTRMNDRKIMPQFDRAVMPADLPLFGRSECVPMDAALLGVLPPFLHENVVEEPREQDQTDEQPPGNAPKPFEPRRCRWRGGEGFVRLSRSHG